MYGLLLYYFFIFISLLQWFRLFILWYLEHSYPVPLINTKYHGRLYIGSKLNQLQIDKVKLEINKIAMETVNCIPNYPIMKGEEFRDKIFIIIYQNNNPIAMNCFFKWYSRNTEIYHGGLFLVSKQYQNKGLQKYLTHFQKYIFLKEFPKLEIYASDLGRSATGWKILDTVSKKCNPSLLNKDSDLDFKRKSKLIADDFYHHVSKKSCGVSIHSTYDKNNLTIKNSNDKEGGGFEELIESEDSRKSRDDTYNNKVLELCPDVKDEFIIIANINIIYIIKQYILNIIKINK